MLWKVIVFLVFLVAALLFIMANLGNVTDISFWWFYTPQKVPVFLAMFFSFAFGILAMVPFLLRLRFTQKRKEKVPKKETPQKDTQEDSPPAPPPG